MTGLTLTLWRNEEERLRRDSGSYYYRCEIPARGLLRAGMAAVFTFVLLLVLGGAGFFGLGERIALAVWLAWLLAIAGRILLKPSPTTGTWSPARA